MISHLVFAATMIFAPLARSLRFATLLVGICGIPWAVTCWAPFAFMGVEINRLAMNPVTNARSTGVTMITSNSIRNGTYQPVGAGDRDDVEPSVLRLNHRDGDSDSEDDGSEGASTGELAGIYLGVLNVYTTLPQFVGTFLSWVIFSIFEPGTKTLGEGGKAENAKAKIDAARNGEWMNLDSDSPNAIAICLFIGALSALVAAEATRRLRFVR
ncbi:hypothetical protein VTN02DRAFT_3589 [Thermoascus thermophilus]